MLNAKGDEIGLRGRRTAPTVPLGEMPPYLVKAVLATEDRRFYEHNGFDPRGIARAMWTNVKSFGFVEGGSTITQQVAKNLYLDNSRTIWRKAQEALITMWLENNLTKDEILSLYLNRIYMGAGNYGMDAAARYYFGKSVRDAIARRSRHSRRPAESAKPFRSRPTTSSGPARAPVRCSTGWSTRSLYRKRSHRRP